MKNKIENSQLQINPIKYREFLLYFITRKRSHSDKKILKEVFEDDIYGKIIKHLSGAVIDCGSYIGETPILFSLLGAKQVYAYEPNPDLYKLMLKNIVLNSNVANNIVTVNKAVGDKSAEGVIVNGRANLSFGIGRHPPFLSKEDTYSVTVKNINEILKEIIRVHKKIELIKIDIEGYEAKVIETILNGYYDKIKTMIIECHNNKKLEIVLRKFKDFNNWTIHIVSKTKKKTHTLTLLYLINKKI